MPANWNTQRPDLFDPRFARLTPYAKLSYWNVLNSRARTTEGLYRLPAAYVAVDMGLDIEQVLDGFKELEAEDYIGWDAERESVLDKLAIKWNPLRYGTDKDGNRKPDNRMVNALKLLHQVADSPLMFELLKLAKHYSPDFAETLEEEFPFLGESPSSPFSPSSPQRGEKSKRRFVNEENRDDEKREVRSAARVHVQDDDGAIW